MSESIEPSCKRIRYTCEDYSDEDSCGEDWLNLKLRGNLQRPFTMQPRKSLETVRVWENIGKKSRDGNTFKCNVVSYNVLAQCLLEEHPYLYTCSAPSSLDWKLRSERLFNELVGLAPDILCLQEVQQLHLGSFYAKFEEIGYSGIFKKKTGDHFDGCAIYFRNSMFELRDELNVEFSQKNFSILNRDNIGLIAKLAYRDDPESVFLVATTHLLYNPRRSDVRLAQMKLFLAEIERFAFYKTESGSGYLPIILTGDFNACPQSALVQLLSTGHVTKSQFPDTYHVFSPDWQRIGITDQCQHLAVYLKRREGKSTEFSDLKIYNSEYSTTVSKTASDALAEQQNTELFGGEIISHSLDLASVYTTYKADGSAEATTFQGYWLTVDYIYFSRCSSLHVTDRLRLPTVQECADGLDRMPNRVCGSDHFILAAVFEFTAKRDAQ